MEFRQRGNSCNCLNGRTEKGPVKSQIGMHLARSQLPFDFSNESYVVHHKLELDPELNGLCTEGHHFW